MESRKKSVRLDHGARTGRGGAGLLEVADELFHIDRAALVQPANADVRIDHHDDIDMLRQAPEQAAQGAWFAPVHAVVEASPASLAQPQHGLVRRPVADEPYAVFIGPERAHEFLQAVLEIEYGSDDRKWRRRDDTPCVRRQKGGEIDGKAPLPPAKAPARGQRVTAPRAQAQSEIERIRDHDEI